MEHQPVILNSLLCFLHNYRSSYPNMAHMIKQFFSQDAILEAVTILHVRLGIDPVGQSIVDLYDEAISQGCNARFAACDLRGMPIVVKNIISNPEMSGHLSPAVITDVKPLVSIFPTPSDLSSPKSDTSISDASSCPLSPKSEGNGTPNTSEQGQDGKQINQSRRKPMRSLDATLKKLTEMRKAEENAVKRESDLPTPPNSASTVNAFPSESVNQLSVFPTMPSATSTAHPMSVSNWISPQVNSNTAQAYINMLKMVQTQSCLASYINKLNINTAAMQSLAAVNSALSPEPAEEERIDVDSDDSAGSSPAPSEHGDSSPMNNSDLGQYAAQQDLSASESPNGKKWVCDHENCSKSFTNKFLLKKHMFIHTGLRPHMCPYCNKSFNRKDNLLRHKKTHQQQNGVHDDSRRATLNDAIHGLFPNLTGVAPFSGDLLNIDQLRMNLEVANRITNGGLNALLSTNPDKKDLLKA